jgi:hypothetical protein
MRSLVVTLSLVLTATAAAAPTGKADVCHRGLTLSVSTAAVPAHLAHGDSTGATFYADADGDGAGDPGAPVVACTAPPGTVADATDCDDADASVHPGAEEVCGNGVDDDCGGDGDATCTPVVPRFSGEVDGTSFGAGVWGAPGDYIAQDYREETVLTQEDFTGDGIPDLVVGGAYNDDIVYNGGIIYIVPGPLPVAGDAADLAVATIYGTGSEDYVGAFQTSLGDLDGDGVSDLIVGGRVFYGPLSGPRSIDDYDAIFALTFYNPRSIYETGLARLPDVNGDGVDELVLSNSCMDYPACTGSLVVISGAELAVSGAVLDESSPGVVQFVGDNHDYLGDGVSTGDVTGDGIADVVGNASHGGRWIAISGQRIAADWASATTVESAAVAAAAVIDGYESTGQLIAISVVADGDYDGDGVNDLLSLSWSTYTGGLIYGPLAGSYDYILPGWETYFGQTSDTDARFSNVQYGLHALGDLDGDGMDELSFGAWLYYGAVAGDYTLADADAVVNGAYNLFRGGDIDGDGIDDLVIADGFGGGDKGVVYFAPSGSL